MEMYEGEPYRFKCNECNWVYEESYNSRDRFAKYPACPDCGSNDIELFNGDCLNCCNSFSKEGEHEGQDVLYCVLHNKYVDDNDFCEDYS